MDRLQHENTVSIEMIAQHSESQGKQNIELQGLCRDLSDEDTQDSGSELYGTYETAKFDVNLEVDPTSNTKIATEGKSVVNTKW